MGQRPVVVLHAPVQQVICSSVFTQVSPANWQASWLPPANPQVRVASQVLEQHSAFVVQAAPCERQSEPQTPFRQPSEQQSSALVHEIPSALQ
jgi:hypothetical protein